MRIIGFLSLLFFLLHTSHTNAQVNNDSADYWVNSYYVACLDSGGSVCECEQKHDLLMLHMNRETRILTIVPSVYHSLESFELNTVVLNKKNRFMVVSGPGLDSGTNLRFTSLYLTIKTPKGPVLFTPLKVPAIEKNTDADMRKQVGVLNCKPLLKYVTKPCDGSKLLLTKEHMRDLVAKGGITLNCSDDHHYNELHLTNPPTEFFLSYEEDKIRMYKHPPRDRGETIDIRKLKQCQEFYRNK